MTMDGHGHKISTILLNCTDQLLEIVGRTSQCNDVHWALESSTSFSADQRSCSREFHQSEDTATSCCLRLNPLASEHSAPAHFVLHRCVLACWSLFCNLLICTGFPCARHSAAPACLVQGQIPKSSAPRTAVLRIKDYQDFDEKSPTTKQ